MHDQQYIKKKILNVSFLMLVTTTTRVYLIVNIHGWSLSYILRNFDIEFSFIDPK